MTSKLQILIGLVCIVFLGTSIASANIVDGIVAYWSFDSDFTADNGGVTFDLTAVNGAAAGVTGGQFGGAASFTRSTDQYAYTTGNVLTYEADFSYSVWYKCNTADLPTYGRYQILETASVDAVPADGDLGYSASFALRDENKVEKGYVGTRFDNGNNGHIWFLEGAGSTDWHNLIVTYDNNGGTSGRGLHTVYVDGVQVASLNTYGSPVAVESLVVGARGRGGDNFDGLVDDLAFWGRVLTSDEITQIQTSAVPEPMTLGLLGFGGMMLLRRKKQI